MALLRVTLLALVVLAAGLAHAGDIELVSTNRTVHEGVFNGESVRYTALLEERRYSVEGALAGQFVTVSYVREDVADRASRPVIFLFNGGPGASTTPLHFSAFGPKRRTGTDDDAVMYDNQHSILDAADLVFIDPVGTGYSRLADGAERGLVWSRTGDAVSVAAFIRDWLARHDREASPRYLLGQSYGTARAAEIHRVDPELEFDGVMLFALVAGPRPGPLGPMTALPTMAATAWYHGRAGQHHDSLEAVFEEAVEFARSDYVQALIRGASLPAAERRTMAERVAAFTGLSADLVEENNLRLDNRTFMLNLLADQGLRTGQLDSRATRSLDAPPQRPPHDDPGLGFAPSDPDLPDDLPGLLERGGHDSIVETYFRDVLGYQGDEIYAGLNLDVNSAWDHEGGGNAIGLLAEAMERNARLRVFWVAGYYDLTTSVYAGRYTLDQGDIPADRLTAAYFPSGHSVYVETVNLERLSHAVREFLGGRE